MSHRPIPKSGSWRALVHETSGAAALEFALVALPFLALAGAILQIALQIWAAQNFDHAVQSAVRTLFTGQFQVANSGQTDAAKLLGALKTTLCGTSTAPVSTVFNCQNVKLDVAVSSSFAASQPASAVNAATGTWNADFGTKYACAKPGAIVTVTAAVPFPTFFSMLGLNMKTFADGSHLLMSTAVFRTEPYQAASASAC
jgi:Flp pilus assembly protein TadG